MLALLNPVPEPQRLIDAIAQDAPVAQCIIQAVQSGEVDALNDMGLFRRRSHRGSRAEAQTLQHLGVSLSPFGIEWEDKSNQCRFLVRGRFEGSLRLVHCRGELRGCHALW